jgi:hypothetical protein
VPLGLLRALHDAIPALTAEESLVASERVALGSGSLDKHDARQLRRAWRETAFGRVRVTPQKAAPADLAALGIGYHVVEPSSGQ